MTTWNPNRNPNHYPAHWHGIITAKPGRYILATTTDPKEPKRLMNKFNAFKACLRNHPLHESTQALAKRNVRASVETSQAGIAVCITISWARELTSLLEKQVFG